MEKSISLGTTSARHIVFENKYRKYYAVFYTYKNLVSLSRNTVLIKSWSKNLNETLDTNRYSSFISNMDIKPYVYTRDEDFKEEFYKIVIPQFEKFADDFRAKPEYAEYIYCELFVEEYLHTIDKWNRAVEITEFVKQNELKWTAKHIEAILEKPNSY